MTPAALGEMSAQMTTSVALLMNTTYICMDHSHRVVFYLRLDRSLLGPLDNVLLGKTTVIGMVSIYIDFSCCIKTKLRPDSGLMFVNCILFFQPLFSECTSWVGWCDDIWLCGTVYDKEIYEAGPPPPCPPPPPNHHPPVKPGMCKFNISSGKCSFFPNDTGLYLHHYILSLSHILY